MLRFLTTIKEKFELIWNMLMERIDESFDFLIQIAFTYINSKASQRIFSIKTSHNQY
jgi:hypothetical protein